MYLFWIFSAMITKTEYRAKAIGILKSLAQTLWTEIGKYQANETVYAFLFGVTNQFPSAYPIAATEESLTSLAKSYLAMGYGVQSAKIDPLESLRTLLRWDAPGDDKTGWYWIKSKKNFGLDPLTEKALAAGIMKMCEPAPMEELCVQALAELAGEGLFGPAKKRQVMVLGISDVENFDKFLVHNKELNSPEAMNRLKRQLKDRDKIQHQIKSPHDRPR